MRPTEDARPASAIPGPDRGAIFSGILRRQALRREAQLPLLNVRAEYQRAVEQARWQAHVETYGEAVRIQVLAELREGHGPEFGYSAGGMWAVRLLAAKRLREMFDGLEVKADRPNIMHLAHRLGDCFRPVAATLYRLGLPLPVRPGHRIVPRSLQAE